MPSKQEIAELVDEYLPLVNHVVNQVSAQFPRHVDANELARAGAYGLVQAANRFETSRGVPFRAFASHRIRGAILDAVRRADWAPRSVRQAMRMAETARHALANDLGRTPSDAEVAERIGVSVSGLRDVRAHATRSMVLTLDDAVVASGEVISLGDSLSDPTLVEPAEQLEIKEMHGYLLDAVALLPERHRAVVQRTFLDDHTNQEVADELGVSVSRISQLRTEALTMLRDGLTAQFDGTAEQPHPEKGRVARRKATYAAAIAARSTWKDRLTAVAAAETGARRYA